MALSQHSLPRLPEGPRRRTYSGKDVIWHGGGTDGAGFKGTRHVPSVFLSPCAVLTSGIQITGIKSRTFDIPDGTSDLNGPAEKKTYRVQLTGREKTRGEELIRNPKSLQEITRLEKELNEGRIPGGGGTGRGRADDEMEE